MAYCQIYFLLYSYTTSIFTAARRLLIYYQVYLFSACFQHDVIRHFYTGIISPMAFLIDTAADE